MEKTIAILFCHSILCFLIGTGLMVLERVKDLVDVGLSYDTPLYPPFLNIPIPLSLLWDLWVLIIIGSFFGILYTTYRLVKYFLE